MLFSRRASTCTILASLIFSTFVAFFAMPKDHLITGFISQLLLEFHHSPLTLTRIWPVAPILVASHPGTVYTLVTIWSPGPLSARQRDLGLVQKPSIVLSPMLILNVAGFANSFRNFIIHLNMLWLSSAIMWVLSLWQPTWFIIAARSTSRLTSTSCERRSLLAKFEYFMSLLVISLRTLWRKGFPYNCSRIFGQDHIKDF